MDSKMIKRMKRILPGVAFLLAAPSVVATEGNGPGIYPDGLENYMSGALPAEGVHVLLYGGSARYDHVRDNNGHDISGPGFSMNVNILAPRIIWVTEQHLLGGQLAFHSILPLLDVTAKSYGRKYTSQGLGDITLGSALGFHPSPDLHFVLGMDLFAPTGDYDRYDPSSLGRNYWAVQPVWAISYIPQKGVNADIKMMYDFNFRNEDSHTRSGQAFHADYALGWAVGNGWVVGIGGYAFMQTTNDDGPNSASAKSQAFSIGPSVRYANDRGWLLTLKWQKEMDVRNRPEGSQLYLKASIPL
ncbi:transporter [Citrobacter freundii]|uniref:SphA family protein n=1 Tax=Citrobacter portucalensis TaxID=1639133 RepID=UPI001D16D7AC|nr:transporter [Citrobacter freundii]